jgi:hypothetical protein
MPKQIVHIELHEEGETIITHDEIDDEYTLEMAKEDYAGATVTETCLCRDKSVG